MNAPERVFLPDIQSAADHRRLAIERVGVKGVRYPLRIAMPAGGVAHTVASLNMTVGLPAAQKGTHMSRFIEVLEEGDAALRLEDFGTMAARMLRRLDAPSGCIEARFAYFVRKRAPVSGVASLLDIDVALEVAQRAGETARTTLSVVVPVTSLCPCSKEISAYGAHNQRSHLSLRVELRAPMAIEDLVRIAEDEASCQIFGLLKRPDEKYVTERAYDNPKFVEDLVRDIALRLKREPRVRRFVVESENFESIHNHSAYALIEGDNG